MNRREGLPDILRNIRLPLIGAPMFLVSGPDLVIEMCKAGIVGSFPSLNARDKPGASSALEAWLKKITEELNLHDQQNPSRPAAPFAVNLIVHRSNERLERDMEICAAYDVPIWITSLGARADVFDRAHKCGAIVLHDVIHNEFARKAIDKGADGLIAVAAGAGGHAGTLSPFALLSEIRMWFNGPLALSGSIANGRSLLAAQIAGADFGYAGSLFISANESLAANHYKELVNNSSASDIVYTDLFSGIHANYLKQSIKNAGFDPDCLPGNLDKQNHHPQAWKDILSAGHAVGQINQTQSAQEIVQRILQEYALAINEVKALSDLSSN